MNKREYALKNRRLSILADENIPKVNEIFSQFGSIKRVDGRSLSADQLTGIDVLLVRSVTKVDKHLLEGSSVKFVGSATIGTDHIDKHYLQEKGITFSNAPGCNADSVVEYDLCCLSQILAMKNESLIDKTIAIIGVGNVGRKLQQRLEAIGVKKLLLNDPPRAQQESGFSELEFCFKNADIIAMHTPLIKDGAWPTHHLVTIDELKLLKPNAIILNAGRGPAIKAADLLAFLKQRTDIRAVLDVWEHEPSVDKKLADLVAIATSHIAGYSLEGKVRGTYMLKLAFCQLLNIEAKDSLDHYLPTPAITSIELTESIDATGIMKLVYDPFVDDRALRATLSETDQPQKFDLLRKHYPIRREFSALKVSTNNAEQHSLLANTGFDALYV
ncbi:MAG: erythronate-4-phosphate dehydrogenase [Oceanospirillaceae bacterium]|jgi:erythronate-4-phosphate dehydrogenase